MKNSKDSVKKNTIFNWTNIASDLLIKSNKQKEITAALRNYFTMLMYLCVVTPVDFVPFCTLFWSQTSES